MTSGQIDLRTTAVLEEELPELAPSARPEADRATPIDYGADEMSFSASTDAPGLMMLSEIYDTGWKAYVDGEEVELYVADHALRSVPVPAGEHTVELRYEPLSLRAGLAITGVTALAVGGVWGTLGWRAIRRRCTRRHANLDIE